MFACVCAVRFLTGSSDILGSAVSRLHANLIWHKFIYHADVVVRMLTYIKHHDAAWRCNMQEHQEMWKKLSSLSKVGESSFIGAKNWTSGGAWSWERGCYIHHHAHWCHLLHAKSCLFDVLCGAFSLTFMLPSCSSSSRQRVNKSKRRYWDFNQQPE